MAQLEVHMSKIALRTKIGRLIAAMYNLVKSEKAPKANLALAENLNDLLQKTADVELAQLVAETRESLRSRITDVIGKIAPSAVPTVSDDLDVLLFVVMGDEDLMSQLNRAAVEYSYAEMIRLLKARLMVAKRQA